MTACVNPQGMSYTYLQDKDIRKKQYIEAIEFYLNKTNLPIVFAENTNTDFSHLFRRYIDNGRLEYITFDGNSGFDKIKGKGYGEAIIMLYAIKHSQILRNCKYLIKVTGRIKVENINKLTNCFWLRFKHIWSCNIDNINSFQTIVFITEPYLLAKLLSSHKEEISEDNRGHNWIENIVAKAICNDKNLKEVRLVPFTYPPLFEAYSGTSNSKYFIKDSIINTLDNLFYCTKIEKNRGNHIISYCYLFSYHLFFLRNRLTKFFKHNI